MLASVNAREVIEKLGLTPLPIEGGYFLETYRSEEVVGVDALDPRYKGARSVSTCIYYLLTAGTVSRIHRLCSDEVFHFYAGDPAEMLQLLPDGSHRIIVLGGNIAEGQSPQVVVPRGIWQGARLVEGGEWALLGTTVAPGFDYEDYENGDRELLSDAYPECAEMIRALTE